MFRERGGVQTRSKFLDLQSYFYLCINMRGLEKAVGEVNSQQMFFKMK